MLLAGRGTGRPDTPPRLVRQPDLAEHPRARFAAGIRDQARVLGYPDPARSALATLSRGLAGLTELSFELEPARRGQRTGPDLISAALTAVPAGQLTVAAAAPGNAASVRALLAAGFVPLGSVQLFRRPATAPVVRLAAWGKTRRRCWSWLPRQRRGCVCCGMPGSTRKS